MRDWKSLLCLKLRDSLPACVDAFLFSDGDDVEQLAEEQIWQRAAKVCSCVDFFCDILSPFLGADMRA